MEDQDAIRAQTLELLQSYQVLIMSKDWDNWIELWADNGVCEFPFAPEGHVRELVGKKEILDYMTGYPGEIEIGAVEKMTVHPMAQANIVSVELSVSGQVVATGNPYNQSYVIFLEAEEGKIVRYREYWNPLVTMQAYGSMDAWLNHFGSAGESSNG